jgi:hypothetical protein
MREVAKWMAVGAALVALAGCGGRSGGVFARGNSGPDEFAVSRQAPLVIPPDFALTPPRPGAPRPQAADSSTQALGAMFGAQPRSQGESALLTRAGAPLAEPGARSTAADPETPTVDKGAVTRDIIAAPEGQGAEASVSVPE